MRAHCASLVAVAFANLLLLVPVEGNHNVSVAEADGYNPKYMENALPYGSPEYRHCDPGIGRWADITEEYYAEKDLKTGGLGDSSTSRFGTWMCIRHPCSDLFFEDTNTSGHFCYVFDEDERKFIAWGKNTDVQLVLTRFHINVYDGSGWFRDISEGATIEHNGVLYDVVPRSCASDGGGPGDHLGAHELSDCTGGFMLPEGANNITIFKHGFLPHHSTIVVKPNDPTTVQSRWIFPDDGNARIVLHWKEGTGNYDIFLFPRNVLTADGQSNVTWKTHGKTACGNAPVDWVRPWTWTDSRRTSACPYQIPAQKTHDQMPYMSPYVYGDTACCDWNVWDPIGCDSWCKMQTDASGYSHESFVKMEREEARVGDTDFTDQMEEGPEVVMLKQLIPGDYHVFINSFQPDGSADWGGRAPWMIQDEFRVDLLFGNQRGTGNSPSGAKNITAAYYPGGNSGRKFFDAGWLHVEDVSSADLCNGDLQQVQVFEGLPANTVRCYTWNEVGQITDYPLNWGSPAPWDAHAPAST